ncbi:ACT domain-containing protein [Lactococcus lactis]|uniref:ACT domain-containing protein n=1 Tax=Lactococcus lactis TaxID=1358 RepID=UPI00034BE789|nr:ACT domain-containing protein [Lactococcus lactis]QOK51428.1 ACT domain-containing protein [Lactococcus lactis]
MKILLLRDNLSIFQVYSVEDLDLSIKPLHIGVTNDEISVIAPTNTVPSITINRNDGWRMFKVEGVLDFSSVGIVSSISSVLAKAKLSIFSISTYNTDYILVKNNNLDKAIKALNAAGLEVIQ